MVIPPLQVGEYKTQPISLQVMETASQNTAAELAPVFVEANLDQTSVYVQAQALLTVRVYHSVSLSFYRIINGHAVFVLGVMTITPGVPIVTFEPFLPLLNFPNYLASDKIPFSPF